ncbi:MAG: hypothetical protein ACJA2G_003280 [Cognaticolwellia sp.]|jgi:hypothetical protein
MPVSTFKQRLATKRVIKPKTAKGAKSIAHETIRKLTSYNAPKRSNNGLDC